MGTISSIDAAGQIREAMDDLKKGAEFATAHEFALASVHLAKAATNLSSVLQQLSARDATQTRTIVALRDKVRELEARLEVGGSIDTRSV